MARIVLVADDSPTIQKKALGILKGEGFEVETVSNGVAAVRRLAFLRPVVILADVSMPGRDGYEVCEYVKTSAEHAHVPVLLIASDMEPYDEVRGAQVRADGRVIKPFDSHELISIVERFAAQCEESAASGMEPTQLMEAPILPPQAPEHSASEGEEAAPAEVNHGAPDFSEASGGIAFSEPESEAEAASNYLTESAPAEMEAPAGDTGLPVETPPAHESAEEFLSSIVESEPAAPSPSPASVVPEEPAAPPTVDYPVVSEESTAVAVSVPSVPADEPPVVFDEPQAPTRDVEPEAETAPEVEFTPPVEPTPEAETAYRTETAPEPVFIEEQSAPAEHSHPHEAAETMIFCTPAHLADPVWRDETLPAPPPPEPVATLEPEPQFESQLEPEPPAPEITQPAAPDHAASQVSATSLDSFSLDDATTGQVRFISRDAEMVIEQALRQEGETEAPLVAESPMEAPTEAPVEPEAELAPEFAVEPEAAVESEGEVALAAEVAPVEAPLEAETESAAEVPAEAPAPALELDWNMIFEIVHHVVGRMAPPALPREAAEEMARRLAEEIASELGQPPPPPQE